MAQKQKITVRNKTSYEANHKLSGFEWVTLTLLTLLVIGNIRKLIDILVRDFNEFIYIFPPLFSIFAYIGLIIFILLKLSNIRKARICMAIGIIALIDFTLNFLSNYLPESVYNNYYYLPIFNIVYGLSRALVIMSVFALAYSIAILKSEAGNLAKAAIVLNVIALLINWEWIYFVLYYIFIPFAP